MSVHLVKAELFLEDRRTDGRTDITKLIVAFSQFCEKNFKNLNKLSGTTVPRSQSSKEYPCSQAVKNNVATPGHPNNRLP